MKTIRTVVALALACALQYAWGQEDWKMGGGGGISYLSGGVGSEQREAMAAHRAEYNLYLKFAHRGGELLAGVAMRITDRQRNPVLIADGVGPHVYVKLPPGTYWITVTAEEMDQSRSVTIGKRGTRQVTFHWAPVDQATVR